MAFGRGWRAHTIPWSRTLVIMKSGPQCESPTVGSTKLEPFCGVQCRNRKWNSEESATCRNIWGMKRGLVSMINVNNLICGTNCTTSCVPAQRHYSQKHHGSKYPQSINKQSTKWSSSGFFVGTWRNGLITGSPSLCTNNVQNWDMWSLSPKPLYHHSNQFLKWGSKRITWLIQLLIADPEPPQECQISQMSNKCIGFGVVNVTSIHLKLMERRLLMKSGDESISRRTDIARWYIQTPLRLGWPP